jgi:hypothetical protein
MTPLEPAGLTYYTKRKYLRGVAFSGRPLVAIIFGNSPPDAIQMLSIYGVFGRKQRLVILMPAPKRFSTGYAHQRFATDCVLGRAVAQDDFDGVRIDAATAKQAVTDGNFHSSVAVEIGEGNRGGKEAGVGVKAGAVDAVTDDPFLFPACSAAGEVGCVQPVGSLAGP